MRIDKLYREVQLIEKGGDEEKYKIEDPWDAREVAIDILANETQEVFIVIALDESLTVQGYREIARGGFNFAQFEEIAIFQFLMLTNCKKFIIAHNHLSDECKPSEADDKATRKIEQAAKRMETTLLDHIIVSRKGSYSYEDHGFIDRNFS